MVKSVYHLPTASQSASEWLSQLLGGFTPRPNQGLLSQKKVHADRVGSGECGPADYKLAGGQEQTKLKRGEDGRTDGSIDAASERASSWPNAAGWDGCGRHVCSSVGLIKCGVTRLVNGKELYASSQTPH